MTERQLEAELDLVDVRARTRALINESVPVLHDLTEALERAQQMLDRLEEEATP